MSELGLTQLVLWVLSTQQNSYSISHLLGTVTTTVTMQSLFSSPWHRNYWTATILDTHDISIHYHGAYVEICLLGI